MKGANDTLKAEGTFGKYGNKKKKGKESARKIQEAGREREGGRGGTENEAWGGEGGWSNTF